MNAKKLLLMVVLLVAALSVAGIASAGNGMSASPRIHAPQCQTIATTPNEFRLTCQDAGKDIKHVQVYSELPLHYTLKYDAAKVSLVVEFGNGPVSFKWSVFDQQGNITSGEYVK